jgi:hypothetical protein
MAPGKGRGHLLAAADFLIFFDLCFIGSDMCKGFDTTDGKLIIVYGIQRTDVKNCFYEKVSCDPMDRSWG